MNADSDLNISRLTGGANLVPGSTATVTGTRTVGRYRRKSGTSVWCRFFQNHHLVTDGRCPVNMEHTSHEPCLPPELWDRVIDHLHDDKLVLKRTSLVCKEWTPSSQFHLFHEIYYDRRLSILQFITIAPHLAACIRCLTIKSGPYSMSELRDVLDTMPGLKKLGIHHSFYPLGLPPARSRATPISELEFRDCHLPLESFLNILSMFTSIDNLTLSYIILFRAEDIASEPPAFHTLPSLPPIRKLSAVYLAIKYLNIVVQNLTPVMSVDTLIVSLSFRRWEEVEHFREVLTGLRSTLRTLDFSPWFIDRNNWTETVVQNREWRPEQLWERMDLGQCVSLEILNLYRDRAQSNIGVILQVYLAACKSAPPSLRTLHIYMQALPTSYSTPPAAGYDAGAFWGVLDTMLLRARPGLTVTLEVCDTAPKVEQFIAFVARHLPGAVEQERLRLMEKILIGSTGD